MPELENVDPETVETVVQVLIFDLLFPVRDLILCLRQHDHLVFVHQAAFNILWIW